MLKVVWFLYVRVVRDLFAYHGEENVPSVGTGDEFMTVKLIVLLLLYFIGNAKDQRKAHWNYLKYVNFTRASYKANWGQQTKFLNLFRKENVYPFPSVYVCSLLVSEHVTCYTKTKFVEHEKHTKFVVKSLWKHQATSRYWPYPGGMLMSNVCKHNMHFIPISWEQYKFWFYFLFWRIVWYSSSIYL